MSDKTGMKRGDSDVGPTDERQMLDALLGLALGKSPPDLIHDAERAGREALVDAPVLPARGWTLDWATRFVCPGCDRRYEAWQGNRFFLSFEICPACGTDKKEFEATDCMREADGTWTDRAELEAVEKALRGDV